MDNQTYIDYIKNMLSENYDLQEELYVLDKFVKVYGQWSMEFGRHLLSKKMIIDKFQCNEHCFVFEQDQVNEDYFKDITDFLKRCTVDIVKPHRDHKTTFITAVILTRNVSPDIIKKVKRFNYTKNYKLSFYGWSSVRIILADMDNEKIYGNSISRDFMKSISFSNVLVRRIS